MATSVVDGFWVTNATPVDGRLVITSSAPLFVSGTNDILPAFQRYIGMEVYVTTHTCSYTLISGESVNGVQNGVWITGSATSSYALTSKSSSWAPSYSLTSGSLYPITSSWAQSASWAETSSYYNYYNVTIYHESSSFASSSNSSSVAETASYSKTSSVSIEANSLKGIYIYPFDYTNVATGNQTTYSSNTGSFKSIFIEYVLFKDNNIRSGIIFGSWFSNLINFIETTNGDIGNTSDVSLSLIISDDNVILNGSFSTTDWNIKGNVKFI